jgi:hypothetical protein
VPSRTVAARWSGCRCRRGLRWVRSRCTQVVHHRAYAPRARACPPDAARPARRGRTTSTSCSRFAGARRSVPGSFWTSRKNGLRWSSGTAEGELTRAPAARVRALGNRSRYSDNGFLRRKGKGGQRGRFELSLLSIRPRLPRANDRGSSRRSAPGSFWNSRRTRPSRSRTPPSAPLALSRTISTSRRVTWPETSSTSFSRNTTTTSPEAKCWSISRGAGVAAGRGPWRRKAPSAAPPRSPKPSIASTETGASGSRPPSAPPRRPAPLRPIRERGRSRRNRRTLRRSDAGFAESRS